MTGGKKKLNQLFTSQLKVGVDGTDSIGQVLSGSATMVGVCGISACGEETDTLNWNLCVVGEITVENLNPCDMMFANVWSPTACLVYCGEVLAGDGQASIVMRYTGSSASMDPAWGGTVRYIAFQLV